MAASEKNLTHHSSEHEQFFSLSSEIVSFSVPDEKEKFEPTVFRDTIVSGLNEAGGDLDAVTKFLDVTGSRLDYRRYADTLFDILVAGSMLAGCHVALCKG